MPMDSKALAEYDDGTWAQGATDKEVYRVIRCINLAGEDTKGIQRVSTGRFYVPSGLGGQFLLLPKGTVLEIII